jgi:glutathione S-transferase
MQQIQLYSGPLSMFGAKAQIAALEKGIAFDLIMVPFTAGHRYLPKHPDVVRINPKGQVPVLIDGHVEIFDSTQIFEYFEDLKPQPALWPLSVSGRALARSLEHQSDEVLFPYIIRLMGLQETPLDPVASDARAAASAFYERMDDVLGDQSYLAGALSYADIALFMAQLFGDRMGAPMLPRTPRLLKWRERMAARPAIQQVVGPMAAHLAATGRTVPAWLHAALAQGGR